MTRNLIPTPIDIEAIRNGDRLGLTRLLTQVENESPQGRLALEEIFPYTGHAKMIGVTGAPGAGKSSLVNQLALALRKKFPSKKIAILAVDPTSPFSGGAMLGDRVRMRALSGDVNIFIRSMASRGALGGLAWSTEQLMQVFDAAGFDYVIVETVGAGQSEVDVCRVADVTLVIEVPGLGDDIQALKAGILETADILVVNKADKAGAESTAKTLENMLSLSPARMAGWEIPVLLTNSVSGEGVTELMDALLAFLAFSEENGAREDRALGRIRRHFSQAVAQGFFEKWEAEIGKDAFEEMVREIYEKEQNPYQLLDAIITTFIE
jgi:LAO/AO transport system kinase